MIIKFTTKKMTYSDCFSLKNLWVYNYTMTDPSHLSGSPDWTNVDRFNTGDVLDMAFPIQDADHPVYSDVHAAATVDNRDWHIKVFYSTSGFGEGYRVIFTALRDNITLDNFRIYFKWHGAGSPGSQPWGFLSAADALSQHTETGYTVPEPWLCLPSKIVKVCNIVGCPPYPRPWLWSERPSDKFVKLMSEDKQNATKLQKIKDEAARLVKKLEKASEEDQVKIVERAGVLLNDLQKMGFEDAEKPARKTARKKKR